MGSFDDINWGRLLLPDTPLLEIVIRGTVMYLALFLVLRLVLSRQAGAVGITDLLVVVLLAEAAQNGLADNYTSLSDGVLLVLVVIFWSYALDWLGYRFPWVERLLRPPALPLVRNGRLLRGNMRRELITEGELMSQLRQQGVSDLGQVKAVFMEGDGRFSVITTESDGAQRG